MPLDAVINIVSVDDAIIELGLDEAQRARVERLVNAASARIESYTRSRFKARIFNITMDGTSSPLLDLGAPVVSVASVQLGDTILSEAAGDYQVLHERGQLFRSVGWVGARGNRPSGVRDVLVTATLGYSTIPYEVQEVAFALVRAWHVSASGGGGGVSVGGLQSEKIGDYAYSRFAPSSGSFTSQFFGVAADLGDTIASMLSPFVRHGV